MDWINGARDRDKYQAIVNLVINPLNVQLNPICLLLAL
jgi:hypothetical protein